MRRLVVHLMYTSHILPKYLAIAGENVTGLTKHEEYQGSEAEGGFGSIRRVTVYRGKKKYDAGAKVLKTWESKDRDLTLFVSNSSQSRRFDADLPCSKLTLRP